MFMHRIRLRNILSFGSDEQDLELKPLNVLIGPNGSGKSNFIDVIGLLQAAPKELTAPVTAGGGISNWIWKGKKTISSVSEPVFAEIGADLYYPSNDILLCHDLAFAGKRQHLEVVNESVKPKPIDSLDSIHDSDADFFLHHKYFTWHDGRPLPPGLTAREENQPLTSYDYQKSVLSQFRDPVRYPELAWLGDTYLMIRFYREWSFGRQIPPRFHQDAALPNDFLIEGGQNLGMMLNRLKREPTAKKEFLKRAQQMYEGIDDFDVIIEGGTVQVILQEGNNIMPAVRLSDGTLRYLCLLAILCHPNPPPLICLEEPELGLHPDLLPGLVDLLREASERCQIIVTTHSDIVVDALTDTPESVVICEKEHGQTKLKSLDGEELSHWLEKYRLGELWSSGEIGGNRW